MEGGESPLDVLSRAATMVQANQAVEAEDCTKQNGSNKQQLTTKWKRDRRSRLPEYSRKSDPKIPEVFNQLEGVSPVGNNGVGEGKCTNGENKDIPLDMSIRHRGQPPSYAQTISNPGYRSNYRPSVIQNGVPTRDDIPSGISMCDPIIDEHFRRSLGNDYLTLYSNNNVSKDTTSSCNKSAQQKVTTTTSVIELMDNTGLTVDDHFAKALGDTWLKLNKKDGEIKNNSADNQSVVSI